MRKFERVFYLTVSSLMALLGIWMMADGAPKYALLEPPLLFVAGLLANRGLRKERVVPKKPQSE